MKHLTTKTLAAVAVAASMGLANAQDINKHSFKLAMQNPKGHPAAEGAAKFAELVEAKSDGKMKIKPFLGGVLGGDAQTVSALQGGTIEIVVLNSGILASQAKEFAVYDFPFLFATPQEADAVVDGSFGKGLHAQLEDKGIIGLSYWELGFRDLSNSVRPINKAEDIAGLKLRVIPNEINIDWVSALGANPTPLAFPELYAALETGAVDGQENPVSVILANKIYDVQKHLALTHHQYNPQSVIFSKKVWDKLTEDEKAVIQEAATEAGQYQRQLTRDRAASDLDELRAEGVEVTELPPTETDKLRELVAPVIEKHRASVGAETVDALMAELEKARQ